MKTAQCVFQLALASFLAVAASAFGQTAELNEQRAPLAATAPTAVPALVQFAGTVEGRVGKAPAGSMEITFLVFKDAQGGEPLWAETQTVAVDADGHYSVQLGATLPKGLPDDLFASGEARWLEVQTGVGAPQKRVLLVSVPYALKAADATTLGGLPASAFALAGSTVAGSAAGKATPETSASAVTTPGGVAGYLPVYSAAAIIDDSVIYQSGKSVGIDTTTPASALDVNGAITARGAVSVESTGTATATAGDDSQPVALFASAYNSSTKKAVAQQFNLQAEPAANNTAAPAATLNLLFGEGTTPAETGFSISSKGIVKFAPGQTFPGTGAGTISGVTTTSPLTGSGTSGSVSLGLNVTALETTLNGKYAQLGAANKFTAPITFATGQTFPGAGTLTGVTAGTGLTGGGTTGTVALALNITALETTLNGKYAQLGAANKFTAPITFATGQTFPGAGTITGVTVGSGLLGGGTTGAIKLSLDASKVPLLTGSPVFNGSAGSGTVGETAGSAVGTAGVVGLAGSGNASGFGGIAGVWGNASAHVGVLGTSDQYSGVQGISNGGQGVLGSSTSGVGVQGTSSESIGVYGQSSVATGVEGLSTSGTGASGSSNSGAGMIGYTAGTTLGTAGTFGIAGPRTTFGGIAGVWGDAANHVGVFGSSNMYAGVQGSSVSAPGVQGNSTSGNGVHGVSQNTSGIFGETSSTSSQDAALFGYAHANAAGVYGSSAYGVGVSGASTTTVGVFGTSTNGTGIEGQSSGKYLDTSGVLGVAGSQSGVTEGIAGVWGDAYGHVGVLGTSSGFVGVQGVSLSAPGVQGTSQQVGVYGIGGSAAAGIQNNGNIVGHIIGVWGDTSGIDPTSNHNDSYAVVGTATNSVAAYFQNNDDDATLVTYNYYNNDTHTMFKTFEAASPGGTCGIGGQGDLTCTGQVKTLSTSSDGARTVETYAMQSPENWMEDFGSATLHNGVATVKIEAAFADTVSQSADYHVFLTPNGDSKGLYVIAKTATSFEVRESGGGTSTLSFDYRIVAKRRGFEAQRMTDVTAEFKASQARISKHLLGHMGPSAHPAAE